MVFEANGVAKWVLTGKVNIYIYIYIYKREMLTNTLRILIYELFLETFYWEDDKTINIVDSFLYFPWK